MSKFMDDWVRYYSIGKTPPDENNEEEKPKKEKKVFKKRVQPAKLEEFKKCPQCGITYKRTDDYFHRNKNRYDGLSSMCKKCTRIKNSKNIDL